MAPCSAIVSTTTPSATTKNDQRMSPIASPIAFETGTIATTMPKVPIEAQMRANAPMRSRSDCS